MNRTIKLFLALAVWIIIAAALSFGPRLLAPRDREPPPQADGRKPVIQTMGSTTAKIRIRAYYPRDMPWNEDALQALRGPNGDSKNGQNGEDLYASRSATTVMGDPKPQQRMESAFLPFLRGRKRGLKKGR